MHWLPPDELTAGTLADAVVQALDAEPGQFDASPDLRGRQRAVEHLVARGADILPIPSDGGRDVGGLISEA